MPQFFKKAWENYIQKLFYFSNKQMTFFYFFAFFRAALVAYGGSQARGPTGAAATGLHHSHSNAGSLTHWARPEIEPMSSLLWLWHRPAATDPIRPLAWEPPYVEGAALEKAKKTKKKKKIVSVTNPFLKVTLLFYCSKIFDIYTKVKKIFKM